MASKAASASASALAAARLPRPRLLLPCLLLSHPRPSLLQRALRRPPAVRAAHAIPRPPPRRPIQPGSGSGSGSDAPPPADVSPDDDPPASEGPRPAVPSPAYYQLSFTCVPCGHRSHHNISRQGYHYGSTLITCPRCRNRHVISDHLDIFGHRSMTVEDLMREKGLLVKRGSLGEDGDIEFWPDEPSAAEQEADDASGKAGTS